MATEGNATTANTMNSVLGMMNTAKEKWDSSGANEALGRLHASIPQSTRDYVSTTTSQVFSRKQIRSISLVFGIGEERPFYVEKAPSLLIARVRHNLTFFVLNYLVVTAIMFCLTLLTDMRTLIGIMLVIGAWFYVLKQAESGSLKIGRKSDVSFSSSATAWYQYTPIHVSIHSCVLSRWIAEGEEIIWLPNLSVQRRRVA